MRVVWKFPIPITDEFSVRMPEGAQLLHVDWQGGHGGQLWALVKDDHPVVGRRFRLAGTGHKLADYNLTWRFVGTFLFRPPAPPLVFHLWDLGE